jgi:hypothetical protein
MAGCNKLKVQVEEWGGSLGQNHIVGHGDYGFSAGGRMSGLNKRTMLLINFKKLSYFQVRQGSTGPLADPDPSPPALFVFPSVIGASSFKTFEKESLNLHSPAPFLP